MDIQYIKSILRTIYSDFTFIITGLATNEGAIIPLNIEPGTLGNIIEGVLIDHLRSKLDNYPGLRMVEGGSRHYPDVELTDGFLEDRILAFDIKAARRNRKNPNRTQSMITLYTFGTYLKDRDTKFSQTLRPFNDYFCHLDLIVFFDVNAENHVVDNFEVIIVEPWRVATKTKSSGTRDYVGAVTDIAKLRAEQGGDFQNVQEFYNFWAQVPRRGEQ